MQIYNKNGSKLYKASIFIGLFLFVDLFIVPELLTFSITAFFLQFTLGLLIPHSTLTIIMGALKGLWWVPLLVAVVEDKNRKTKEEVGTEK